MCVSTKILNLVDWYVFHLTRKRHVVSHPHGIVGQGLRVESHKFGIRPELPGLAFLRPKKQIEVVGLF